MMGTPKTSAVAHIAKVARAAYSRAWFDRARAELDAASVEGREVIAWQAVVIAVLKEID